MESLVSDIPAGDGKIENLFLLSLLFSFYLITETLGRPNNLGTHFDFGRGSWLGNILFNEKTIMVLFFRERDNRYVCERVKKTR